MLGPRLVTLDTRCAKPPPKRGDAIYDDPAWRALVRRLIAERGRRCEDCGVVGRRIYGDHIVELQDGGEPLDPANIRLRCPTCHGRKTAAERVRRMAERPPGRGG